jgi:superfamily I DNA/RNA helicase
VLNGIKGITLTELLFFLDGWGDVAIRDYVHDIRKLELNKLKQLKPKLYGELRAFMEDITILHNSLTQGELEFKDLANKLTLMVIRYVKEKLQNMKKREDIAKTVGSLYHYYSVEVEEDKLINIIENIIDDLDGNVQESEDKIVVGTVHSSKGLAYPVTITMGFTNWKEGEVTNEEICIFYVQCSRAESELHLLYSDIYITKRGQEKIGYINPVLKNVLRMV